jgi:ribosomal RNA-processing protein 1
MTQQLRCGAQLLPLSEHRSAGLTYHLADVWLAELHKVAGGQPLPAEAAAALLAVPLEAVAGSAVQAQVDRVR